MFESTYESRIIIKQKITIASFKSSQKIIREKTITKAYTRKKRMMLKRISLKIKDGKRCCQRKVHIEYSYRRIS